jgi:hypothetical protein
VCVGVWLATRDYPDLVFFLPLLSLPTGNPMQQPLSLKDIMLKLNPTTTPATQTLMHVRVFLPRHKLAQPKPDDARFVCTDIAHSYNLGNTGFNWQQFQ